jgi:hypothetical protein
MKYAWVGYVFRWNGNTDYVAFTATVIRAKIRDNDRNSVGLEPITRQCDLSRLQKSALGLRSTFVDPSSLSLARIATRNPMTRIGWPHPVQNLRNLHIQFEHRVFVFEPGASVTLTRKQWTLDFLSNPRR